MELLVLLAPSLPVTRQLPVGFPDCGMSSVCDYEPCPLVYKPQVFSLIPLGYIF